MRRKTKTTDRRPLPTARSGRTHQEKFRALLEAGYAEVGSKTRRLEHEFAHLDARPLKRIDKPSVKTVSLRGFLKGMQVGEIREKRDRL